MMSESIILGLLIALRIDRDLDNKAIFGALLTLSTITLWIIHGEFIYSYIAILLSVCALVNRFLKKDHPLINVANITLLSMISLSAANWSIPILTAAVLLGATVDRKYSHLETIVLIVASAFALNVTTNYAIMSALICALGLVLAWLELRDKRYLSSIVWIGIVTANIVVSEYSVGIIILLLCVLASAFYTVSMWSSDREEVSWQRLLQIFSIIILAAGIQFGLMGFWSALLVTLSLTTILSSSVDYGHVAKLPYTSMSAFVLLPIGPIMFLLVNGKTGLSLILGLIISFAISACSWRWIGQREKIIGDIDIGYQKISHAILLITFMVIGCVSFLAEDKIGIISYLAMAFMILILFSLMSLDQKIVQLPGRKTLDLKLNQTKVRNYTSIDYKYSLSVNRVGENIVRTGLLLSMEILAYLKRIYPVVALVLILAVIIAGIIDG